MKTKFLALCLSFVVLVGCGSSKEQSILEISEKVFITQINDIYYNFSDYKNRTIAVEGMYAIFWEWDEELRSPAVFRYGPGCCENDGWGGFLLNYDGEFPEVNDWIRVVGTPEIVTASDGYKDLYLNVISLEVMDERGEEMVLQ